MPTTTPCRPDLAFPENAGGMSKLTDTDTMTFIEPARSLGSGPSPAATPGPFTPQPFGLLGSTTVQAFASLESTMPKTFRFFGSGAREPFQFMDLPRDIRFMVYDNLLTRTHKDITLSIPGAPPSAKITLITPDPIAPIHLTCKMLSQEAGPFLKAKILRMSAPWRAPLFIVHAGPIITLLKEGGVLDQILTRISCMRDGFNVPMTDHIQQQLPPDMLLRGQMMHDLLVYTKRAGLWLKRVDTYIDRTEDAKERSMDAIGKGVDYRITTDELAYHPGDESRDDLLRIAVVFGDREPVGFDMRVFFDRLSFMCDLKEVKTVFQTFGWGSEALNFSADDEFLRFDGEMTKKTWEEEWA